MLQKCPSHQPSKVMKTNKLPSFQIKPTVMSSTKGWSWPKVVDIKTPGTPGVWRHKWAKSCAESNAGRARSKKESLLWADRCRVLLVLASVTSLLPSHCSHHQPDAMRTVTNCWCFSPWLHKQHGGGMTLCVCVFVCEESQLGWGTCVWQHAAVPGWVMTSHSGGEPTSVCSQPAAFLRWHTY